MDYIIAPVKMGGLVKAVNGDMVKVHLFGRLGVITVPKRLIIADEPIKPGHETEFYFSYIQVVDDPYDYDAADMRTDSELSPSLLGGRLVEVNDTAVQVEIMDHMGTVGVPRRWVFTDMALEEGQDVEFYFSPMRVKGWRDIPQEMI